MAALDFPDNPATGDLYGSSGTVWRWDGARWASTAGASGARGRVAYAQIVASQASITTGTNINGLSVTWTADPTRTYRTTVFAEVFNPAAAGSVYQIYIATGAGGGLTYAAAVLPNANYGDKAIPMVVETGLSGTTTRKATCSMIAGPGGSLTIAASPTNPSFILVEDITYEAGTSGVGIEPTAWVPVTFQNSWANSGGGNQQTQYRKVGDNVEVRLACGTGTSGTVAFTFPVGYRPPATTRRALDGAGAHALCIINTDGTVSLTGVAMISGGFTFSVTP